MKENCSETLDKFLTMIPDQPTNQVYSQGRSAAINTIIDQLLTIK